MEFEFKIMIHKVFSMHDVTWLVLQVIHAEMYGKYFKEGSIPTYWIGANATFQILRTKFF